MNDKVRKMRAKLKGLFFDLAGATQPSLRPERCQQKSCRRSCAPC